MLSGVYELILKTMKNIEISTVKLDEGINEHRTFHSGIFDKDVSIGISYESDVEFDDGHVGKGYIFNLFIGDEYINIPGAYEYVDSNGKIKFDEFIKVVDKMEERYRNVIKEYKAAAAHKEGQ